MSNPNQNPGQQNQNPGQKPGQQQGGGQRPGQQQQDPSRQGQKPSPGQQADRWFGTDVSETRQVPPKGGIFLFGEGVDFGDSIDQRLAGVRLSG
jgi:hypothetical protein